MSGLHMYLLMKTIMCASGLTGASEVRLAALGRSGRLTWQSMSFVKIL